MRTWMCFLLLAMGLSGCYAPLRTPAISASSLPESYRERTRCYRVFRNMGELAMPYGEYHLGPGDLVDVTIPGLFQDSDFRPLRLQVTDSGHLHLPDVGTVFVGGTSLQEAHLRINEAYSDGILLEPNASITIVERATIPVVVMGEVNIPGVYRLPRGENDVANALALAGGVTLESEDFLEVHRNPYGVAPNGEGVFPSSSLSTVRRQSSTLDNGNRFPFRPVAWSTDERDHNHSPTGATALSQTNRYPLDDAIRNSHRVNQQMRPNHEYVNPVSPHTSQSAISPNLSNAHAMQYPLTALPNSMEAPAIRTVQHPMYGGERFPNHQPSIQEAVDGTYSIFGGGFSSVHRIDLRGQQLNRISSEDVILEAGDVLVVPRRRQQVFYVVGQLNRNTGTRFSLDDRDREIGSGFLLPPDRDIDTVTAVAMAGYIDPINSPTTVSVHRVMPDGTPMMIRVDLIKARYDRQENVIIQPGDIVYLNPDSAWWIRRVIDATIVRIIDASYLKVLQ